jgi:hypothetical protein
MNCWGFGKFDIPTTLFFLFRICVLSVNLEKWGKLLFAELNYLAFVQPRVQSQFLTGPTKIKPDFNPTKHIFLRLTLNLTHNHTIKQVKQHLSKAIESSKENVFHFLRGKIVGFLFFSGCSRWFSFWQNTNVNGLRCLFLQFNHVFLKI